ncbi:MAG TPA: O-antigen translocase [Candidatus Rifleibacterium sp.]|nr:O-antigen translocase [Candidatus Rifleibacterium sp.]
MSQQRYRSAIKSTTMIGGAAFINMFIGLIRTKVVAVLLGPVGMGMMNMYSSLLSPITTVANMGFHTSGVRSIADSAEDAEKLARVVKSLRRIVWVTGLLGALFIALFSHQLSQLSFQNPDHAVSIALLGLVVFFANLSMGQTCLLQGTRRIADVARINIWSAFYATIVSLPCFWFWGRGGIVPSLILTGLATLLTSWWFVRKIEIVNVVVTSNIIWAETRKLLAFGLPVMAASMQTTLTAYFIRLIIANQFGVEGVGIWAAAFTISGVLVNFVLQAMGTDYYPRLVAASVDTKAFNDEVNTQLEIGILLSLPALLLTILFAPLGIKLLYTGQFDAAIPILRWSVFGIFGRVVSWPLGFTILALGRGKLFFVVELAANLLHLALMYFCPQYWGLPGTGLGFAFLYLCYFFLLLPIGHIIAKTRITLQNVKLILSALTLLIACSIFSTFFPENMISYVVSISFLTLATLKVYNRLSALTGLKLTKVLQRIKS